MSRPLVGMNKNDLQELMVRMGQPAYRGAQLAEWLYKRDAFNIGQMTDLPATLRDLLESSFEVGRSKVVALKRSRDGSIKILLRLSDGACVETVGLPYLDRVTCCVSTQVGCGIGCVFCATGRTGFKRNLEAGEIVDQVLTISREIAGENKSSGPNPVDHVTFMGMGEPLLNYGQTVRAVKLLNQELGISARRLTISTAGFVPGILRLAKEEMQLTLAVSLHAPNEALRRRLIPKLSRWSLGEIINACRSYLSTTGRRVTFEYCLLRDVNDSITEARELVKLLQVLNCHVNLIPYNAVKGIPFRTPLTKSVRTFAEVLQRGGIQVTQRMQRGSDIDAACGQLRQRYLTGKENEVHGSHHLHG